MPCIEGRRGAEKTSTVFADFAMLRATFGPAAYRLSALTLHMSELSRHNSEEQRSVVGGHGFNAARNQGRELPSLRGTPR